MEFQTAVITGGGGGLGRAFCEELGATRARIVVADIDLAAAEATVALVKRAGGDGKAVQCDVSDPAQIDALAATAKAWLGDVDLLVNNAGVAVAGDFAAIGLAEWQWIMGINLWGVIYGCRAFVPAMQARRRGAIINVASAAGLLSAPKMAPYNVTKAAVVALSETMHAELARDGIHVSALCPTFFRTNIGEASRGPLDPRMIKLMHSMMDRSKIQAPEVAQAALTAVAKNQLYVVPMADGRAMWRLKRLQPQRFYDLLASKLLRRFTRL
ncbi:MAG: SDR family NAD(P)-dependent oxidoreductase [Deltaproteobacteria bacterium]|nr:SDR family NAD(P)-dependent oxidoreductase [Deltaproteobacteria bacterium]